MLKLTLLLTFVVVLVAANERPWESPRYLEYDTHWSKRLCEDIVHYYQVSLEECKNSCNIQYKHPGSRARCTAANYNSITRECQLMNCGRWPPMPTNSGKDWKGYTKYLIENGQTRYHGAYRNIWTNEQCPFIPNGPGVSAHREKSLIECMDICDKNYKCTGFNFEWVKRECTMRECGKNPPTPKGYSRTEESYSKLRYANEAAEPKCPGALCRN